MIIKQKPSFVSHFLLFCIVPAHKLRLLLCGATCCAGLCGLAAHAQEVEEVVVEAERSENALVDELTSAAVLDGEKLADAGIENVEDVAAYVPNLVLAETSTGTNIVIRGIGAGVNQGFDQSVGLYVDGVPLPRSQMARAPFLDLAGVQVLRGPQYVNDGNYSIAGSVHMITRAAADEFELDLDFTAIPSQNEKKILLTLGAPITDKLGVRFAIERKTSDGYVENVARNEDGPQADNLLVRSVFNYAATEDLTFKLKYENGSFDSRGRQIEIIESQATPDFRSFYNGGSTPAGLDPLTDFREGVFLGAFDEQLLQPYATEQDFLLTGTFYNLSYFGTESDIEGPTDAAPDPAYAGRSYLQVLSDLYTGTFPNGPNGEPAQTNIRGVDLFPFATPFSPPPGLLDSTVDFKRAANEDEFANNDSENITLNVDYRLGNHNFKLIASQIDYEIEERIDTDFTPVPILFTDQSETYEQSFFRLDYASPEEAFVHIKAGASYLDSELTFDEVVKDGFGGPTNQQEAAEFLFNMQNNTDVNTFREYLRGYLEFDPERPFIPYFGRANLGAIQALQFFDLDRQFKQDSQITAAFLSAKINWSERFRTTIGARYTHADKAATRDLAYLLTNGEPFNAEGIAALDAFTFNDPVLGRQTQINNLVTQLGSVYNFQPHTDRVPRLGFYPSGQLSNPALNSEVDAGDPNAPCQQQWTFALGGPCDARNGPRREETLLPSISFEFDVTPDLSMFASVKLANKLGGFDARSISTPFGASTFGVDPGTFSYEDENATTYELGANWFLPDGWGELRAAAFYTDFKDLQVSAADRSVGQNVRNAAGATTLGVEVEGLLTVSDQFNINYSLAWIEFEFGDYPVAACAFNERADGYLITNPVAEAFYGQVGDVVPIYYELANQINPDDLANLFSPVPNGYKRAPVQNQRFLVFEDAGVRGVADVTENFNDVPAGATEILTFGGFNAYSAGTGLGPRVCQFEGRTNQYVADVQGTLTFNYRKEINSLGFMLKPTLDVLYNSGYQTTVRLDDDVAQSEYTQFNGRLAIASLEESWEIAIVGQNLTNEKIVSFASELPIATRIQGSKSHFGFIRPPRSYGLNFRYKFY